MKRKIKDNISVLSGIIATILLSSVLFFSCNGDGDPIEGESNITVKDLPQKAQDFLTNYFYGEEVKTVEKVIIESSNLILYNVSVGEYSIVFNEGGYWQQVSASYGVAIPQGIIPEQIRATLNQRYPGFGVNQINTSGENYEVVLTDNQGGNSIRLTFNQSGEILNESQGAE